MALYGLARHEPAAQVLKQLKLPKVLRELTAEPVHESKIRMHAMFKTVAFRLIRKLEACPVQRRPVGPRDRNEIIAHSTISYRQKDMMQLVRVLSDTYLAGPPPFPRLFFMPPSHHLLNG